MRKKGKFLVYLKKIWLEHSGRFIVPPSPLLFSPKAMEDLTYTSSCSISEVTLRTQFRDATERSADVDTTQPLSAIVKSQCTFINICRIRNNDKINV